MKTLIIYDNEGVIISMITGSYRKPVGIPFLEIEIPKEKLITGVDVSVTPHVAILEDAPKSETELLKEQLLVQEQAIFELAEILAGGVTE